MKLFMKVNPMRLWRCGRLHAVFIRRVDSRHWRICRGVCIPFTRYWLVPLWSLYEFGTLREAFDRLVEMESDGVDSSAGE